MKKRNRLSIFIKEEVIKLTEGKSQIIVIPNITDIDATRVVKIIGKHWAYGTYKLKQRGDDLVIIADKFSKADFDELKYHLKTYTD